MKTKPSLLVIFTVLLFSIITTMAHIEHLRAQFITDTYPLSLAVLSGQAPAPYQYRILTDVVIVGLSQGVGVVQAHLALRIFLGAWAFASLALFLRGFHANRAQVLIGLSLFMYASVAAFAESSLNPNSYVEVSLYLLGGYCIHTRRDRWILPLTIVGALNRETIVFLPLTLGLVRLAGGVRFDLRRLAAGLSPHTIRQSLRRADRA